ncbi:MAG: alpha/beta hydrolase [Deltaproteobacteria bacterium]|nr:alpha/beta hydrolase [Deltaproteobacteria bacterium]
MKHLLFLFLLLQVSPQAYAACDEYVVLLHGLARTSRSMEELEGAFSSEGYRVVNIDYSSREYGINELARIVREEIVSKTQDAEKIHFVTHSMGGIIVRYIQKNDPLPDIGRVVMLSPPNHGSEVVDLLGDTWPFELINGPAGKELGTDEKGLPYSLGRVDFETGIITGDRSFNWINSLIIPGKDDGKVSLNSAKVEGMTDFLVLHVSHTFIMTDNNAIMNCLYFIKNGGFKHPSGGD